MRRKQKLLIAILILSLVNISFIAASYPSLTINSPINDKIYNKKQIMIGLSSDESVSFYYKYNEGVWRKIAGNVKEIKKNLSFEEGRNDITIKAVDKNRSSTAIPVSFYIDSKKPKINKIKTDNKGGFLVDFSEENPISLIFNFGNSLNGFKTYAFNISDCQKLKVKYLCEFNITSEQYLDLTAPYDSQDIECWFELKDIAKNLFTSKNQTLHIDLSAPIITNISYKINRKIVNLRIEILEDNLKRISYMDNLSTNPKWKTLCTKLSNGICEKRIRLTSGAHILNISALDKSNNSVSKIIEVFV